MSTAEKWENMVESGAKALWEQSRSPEYNRVVGVDGPAFPIEWETTVEEAREIARDMARACLTAAFAVKGS